MSEETWSLRYASHLGYRSPDTPLFLHSVGSLDPIRHIEYAASLGLAGVQDVFAGTRTLGVQRQMGQALNRLGLEAGSILYAPLEIVRTPVFTRPAALHDGFLDQMRLAVAVANRIGSRHIAVLAAVNPLLTRETQLGMLVEHLKYAADIAQRGNVVLGLEAIASSVLPPMIIRSLDDAISIVQELASPNVRLIFDSAHVRAIDGDPVEVLNRAYDFIDIVQLADYPGRCEPGTGSVDCESLLLNLLTRNYRGLIELEHAWALTGIEGEQQGMETYRLIDARIRQGPAAVVLKTYRGSTA